MRWTSGLGGRRPAPVLSLRPMLTMNGGALALLVSMSAGCTAPADSAHPESAPADSGRIDTADSDSDTGDDTGTDKKLRIFLLTLDTMRADHITPAHMPWLTSVAEGGVVWENAWGQTWTPSGIGTILSGHNPATWGVESYVRGEESRATSLSTSVPLLAESLSNVGWATATWSANGMADSVTGLDRGIGYLASFGEGQAPAMAVEIVEWATENSASDQLIHLHVNDMHDPYSLWASSCADAMNALPLDACAYDWVSHEARGTLEVDDDLASGAWGPTSPDYATCKASMEALYACEVRYQDDLLAETWARLEAAGFLDDTLVVIAADHGEGLLDPWANHSFDLRAPVTRNWVLVWSPALVAPGTVSVPMGQDDIVPSIQGLLGQDFGMGSTGVPYWEATEDRVVTSFWVGPPPGEGSTEERRSAVVGGGFHYIRTSVGDELLYDIEADPNEQVDLFGSVAVPTVLSEAMAAQEALVAEYSAAPQ